MTCKFCYKVFIYGSCERKMDTEIKKIVKAETLINIEKLKIFILKLVYIRYYTLLCRINFKAEKNEKFKNN